MKKQIYRLMLVTIALGLSGQQACAAFGKYPENQEEKEVIISKQSFENLVKINASSIIVKTLSLQYERLTGRKTSVALGFRLTPSSRLPFGRAIKGWVSNDDDEETGKFFMEARTSGWAITPEFRYYFGRTAGRGFYLAPFLRYEHFNISSAFPLTNENDQSVPVDFKGSNSTMGIGFLIGSQFNLSKRVTLDWWILGPYYTANTLTLSAKDLDLSPDEQQHLQETLDDLEIAWLKPKSTVTNHNASVRAKGSFAALRGFGLCLGFKF